MEFSITILGCNAALPSYGDITSAQVVNVHERLYVVDCGEGMQTKLARYGLKRNKIEAVFISHLHGDHVFGLPGLLTSYAHYQRTRPLIVIGPVGIREMVETMMRLSHAWIDFGMEVVELQHEGLQEVYRDGHVRVCAFPLRHRVPTYGFRFEEVWEMYNIRREKIAEYGLDAARIRAAKRGEDVVLDDGRSLPYGELTWGRPHVRTYAYCSDTMREPGLADYVRGVDVLYHEATYLHDMVVQARERMHATAEEAAETAREAGVKRLVLGHFSTRYADKEVFREEAERIFSPVEVGREGLKVEVAREKYDESI